MIATRHLWILGLGVLGACGGRSPLDDGTNTSALLRPDAGLPPCKRGLTQCGQRNVSLCYDLGRSRDNCGACGQACAPGIACQDGTCQQTHCQGPLTFRALPEIPIDSVQVNFPYLPALGDFDGDGILDVAGIPEVTDAGGYLAGARLLTGTNLLYGAGDGTFPATVPIDTSPTIRNWRNKSADLDGDGILDLLSIRERHSAVTVRRGSGNRQTPFGEAVTYPTNQAPADLLVADLNSDGHPDMVAAVASSLEVWRGLGTGRFEHRASLTTQNEVQIIQAVDWNRDGALDLIFGSPNLHLRYGRGDGSFDPEVVCGLALVSGYEGRYDPSVTRFSIAADVNHNNVIDLVGRPGVLLDLEDCVPSRINPLVSSMGPLAADLVDLNGDGSLDILGQYDVRLGDGKGAFGEPLPPPSRASLALLVGDLNRDGRLDVLSLGTENWQVFLNTCQ